MRLFSTQKILSAPEVPEKAALKVNTISNVNHALWAVKGFSEYSVFMDNSRSFSIQSVVQIDQTEGFLSSL